MQNFLIEGASKSAKVSVESGTTFEAEHLGNFLTVLTALEEKLSLIQRRGDSRVFEGLILKGLVDVDTDFESRESLEKIAQGVKTYLDTCYPDEIPVRFIIERQPPKYVPVPEVLNEEGELISAEPRIEESPYLRIVMKTRLAGGERSTFIEESSRSKPSYEAAQRLFDKLPELSLLRVRERSWFYLALRGFDGAARELQEESKTRGFSSAVIYDSVGGWCCDGNDL